VKRASLKAAAIPELPLAAAMDPEPVDEMQLFEIVDEKELYEQLN